MKPHHELILEEQVVPKQYLSALLRLYPYDIEETLVYSLLKPNPFPHKAILDFIEFARHIHKYHIVKKTKDMPLLEPLFVTMCRVSQRNQMVLHTHQFCFDATLHACAYNIHNPYAHLPLQSIYFVDSIHLHKPASIDTQVDTTLMAITISPTFLFQDLSINACDFLALSIQIADKHGIVFLPARQLGLLCACASLYQIEKPAMQNDFFLLFGISSSKECRSIYFDETNNMFIGLVSGKQSCASFGCLKDMIVTLYHSICIKKHDYPLHAAMITLHFPTRDIGLILAGEERSGKSEIMDALLHICEAASLPCTKVFDDQGTLHDLDNDIYATGSEIGAYIHAEALPRSSIFENIASSVMVKEHNQTTHFLTPFTTHEETLRFHKVDMCIYLDSYTKAKGYHTLDDIGQAISLFQTGIHYKQRHIGPAYSPFFNPFGPAQYPAESTLLLRKYLEIMFLNNIKVGIFYSHYVNTKKVRIYERYANELLQMINDTFLSGNQTN